MFPEWRQIIVNVILKFWKVMPNRARVWAFLNDGEIKAAMGDGVKELLTGKFKDKRSLE